MKLTPAETYEVELSKLALKWTLENSPLNTARFREGIRQIQADALRWAAHCIEIRCDLDLDSDSGSFSLLGKELKKQANQLHPLREESKGGDDHRTNYAVTEVV